MSNDNHQLIYTLFSNLTDNVAKSLVATWGDSIPLFTTHIIATDDKAFLPCVNAWQYVEKGDPAEVMGLRPDGVPYKTFSHMGVRRIQENLVAMSMLIFDFDGKILLSEIQSIFGQYEFVCYTSFNHRRQNPEKGEPAVDKMRVVLPFLKPMPVDKFRELRPVMHCWFDGDGPRITDPVTFSIGQVFLLPVVREEDKSKATAWRNEGELLDWAMFEAIKKTMAAQSPLKYSEAGTNPCGFKLLPDDLLDTATGSIMVRNIDRKISRVRCPFHGDPNPSEFVGITANDTPFLHCKKCGRVYMTRTKADPIISGIAKLKALKRLRSEQENK